MCDTDVQHFSCIEIDVVALDRPIYLAALLAEV